ncbi:hypothetical protein GH5_05830 [Leishmania sp. Ghana 2012 LV757]|uniref:hypothetical protein n=1 Tax=Leishmania sp. Ghana 2012 LV757 TaxID=2803181 RepID=UPI001B65A76B|nr:hypothetical protein GH5_05830 [Leishmania sp. Ghana 2012 LV757]
MSYGSSPSPYGPLRGPSPPAQRRKVATGRRLTPLPPPLLSSSSAAVTAGAGAGGNCRPRQDAQRPLPHVSQIDRTARHDARSASSKTAVAAASLRLLFAETAPTSRSSRLESGTCRVSVGGRTAARPSSKEGQRRHGSPATGHLTPQLAERFSDVPAKPCVVASSTFTHGRPNPRAPASQCNGCSGLVGGPAEREESRVLETAATGKNMSRPPAHLERNGQRQAWRGTSLRIVEKDATTTPSGPLGTDAGLPSSSAEQRQGRIDLPYAPHDMDEPFFTDAQNWKTEEELPGPVWALLEGVALEAPYTSDLWTQAYVSPAELLSVPKESASELPDVFLHREAQQRTNGFYACVRCGTPVCSPAHQVIPAYGSLRGIAVFDALHMDGVKLYVSMSTLKGEARRLSSMRRCSLSRSRAAILQNRVDVAAELDAAAGGLRFLVRCRHCNGCLGAMRLGESARADSTNASKSSGLAATLAAAPTTALFCANSVCLAYMPHRTRARLDQALLDNTVPDFNVSSSSDGGAAAEAPGQSRVVLDSLFASQNGSVVCGLEEAADGDRQVKRGTRFVDDKDNDDLGGSFDDLLAELNPYGDPASLSSGDDSDD